MRLLHGIQSFLLDMERMTENYFRAEINVEFSMYMNKCYLYKSLYKNNTGINMFVWYWEITYSTVYLI